MEKVLDKLKNSRNVSNQDLALLIIHQTEYIQIIHNLFTQKLNDGDSSPVQEERRGRNDRKSPEQQFQERFLPFNESKVLVKMVEDKGLFSYEFRDFDGILDDKTNLIGPNDVKLENVDIKREEIQTALNEPFPFSTHNNTAFRSSEIVDKRGYEARDTTDHTFLKETTIRRRNLRKAKSEVIVNSNSPPKERKKYKKYKKRVLTEDEKLEKLERLAQRKLNSRNYSRIYREVGNCNETCSICLRKFTNITQYNKDQIRHTQALSDLNGSFSCPECNRTIPSKFLVTNHFSMEHSDLDVTCCCECSEIIPTGNNRLRRHILKFHHSVKETFICALCGKPTSGKRLLDMHMDKYHSDNVAATCEQCGQKFRIKRDYQRHLYKKHLPRNLKCLHCSKKFESRDQALKHLVIHTGMKPYSCNKCPYTSYRTLNVTRMHHEIAHGGRGNNEDVIMDIIQSDRMHEIARADVQKMVEKRKENSTEEEPKDSILILDQELLDVYGLVSNDAKLFPQLAAYDSHLNIPDDIMDPNKKSQLEVLFDNITDRWLGEGAKKRTLAKCKLCSKEVRRDKRLKHLKGNHRNQYGGP